MTLIRLITLFLILVTSTLDAFAFGPRDMQAISRRVGGKYEQGSARVNGITQPIVGVFGVSSAGEVVAAVKAQTQNRYTVTNEWSPYGRVLVIAKIYSSMCPACPKPTPANLPKIVAETYAITLLETELGLLVFGSQAGRVVSRHDEQPAYSDSWLKYLADHSHLTGFSEFSFSENSTRQMMGTLEGSQAEAFALVERSMMNEGYQRVLAAPEATGGLSHWRNGQKLTRVHISQPQQGKVAWQAFEVETP